MKTNEIARSQTATGQRAKVVNIEDGKLNSRKQSDRVHYKFESTPNKVARVGKYARSSVSSTRCIDKANVPVHIDALELQQHLNRQRGQLKS